MSSLKDTLRSDLTESIRERDELRSSTLRMALTSVTNEEVAGERARELSDDEVLSLLVREAKRRREAATAYDDANRPELAERERAELLVIEGYLPAQLSDEELSAMVADAIADTGAEGPRAMGQVMKVVQPKVAKRADGGRVSAEVRRQLG
ncbi:MAG: GatB/YqeY domain-containing protein, partial [Actinomycetales bacterium]